MHEFRWLLGGLSEQAATRQAVKNTPRRIDDDPHEIAALTARMRS